MPRDIEWSNGDNAEHGGGNGFEIFAVLWRRKPVVAISVGVILVLGLLYYAKAPPVYESTAQVLLIKKETDPGTAGMTQTMGYEDTLSTQMLLIQSPLIVDSALEAHGETLGGFFDGKEEGGLGLVATLQGVLRAVSRLRSQGTEADGELTPTELIINKRLQVEPAGDSKLEDPNVIEVRYRSRSPQESYQVLNAIVESYQDRLGETYQDFSQETVELITQAKDDLYKRQAELEAEYREFRRSSPLLWQGEGEGSSNLHERRMLEIEEVRSQMIVTQTQLSAQLATIEDAVRSGADKESLAVLLDGIVAADTNERSRPSEFELWREDYEAARIAALLEEQKLRQDYGDDHPLVAIAQQKVATLERQMADAYQFEGRDQDRDLEAEIEAIRHRLAITEQEIAKYDKQFEEERAKAKDLLDVQLQDEAFRAEIAQTEQLFARIMERLEEINLVKDYGGISTRLIAAPRLGELIAPMLLKVMAIALFLGFFLGCGLAFLIEWADKSFRTPEDVVKQLGLPIVGHVPHYRSNAVGKGGASVSALDPALSTFHHPRGRIAEAFRAVRTVLYFDAARTNRNVVQVTSPTPGDGKSTLAANLAVSMANSGKSVLLVDCDLRRPRVHKVFGLDNRVGLSSVINEKTPLDEAVRTTTVENLTILPSGPMPHNPADLLTSPRFASLIDLLREKFDFVLIDSPPVLAVSDPSSIAPRVDSVLMVIRLGKRARLTAMRAAALLDSVGATIQGIVINGVASGRGGSYGGYSGNRRNAYRYGGNYGYGEGTQKYYSEEKAPAPPLEATRGGTW